jgi:hypothetical protein
MRRPFLTFLIVFILAIGLAGCGGDDSSQGADGGGRPESPSQNSAPVPQTATRAQGKTFSIGLPTGWEVRQPNAISELFVKHASTPDVELGVRSSPIAGGSAGLDEYVNGQTAQLKGFTNTKEVTGPRALDYQVGGERATTFDWLFNAKVSSGQRADVRQRRVIVVRATRLYDITFQAPSSTFGSAERDLEVMLRTWSFQ